MRFIFDPDGNSYLYDQYNKALGSQKTWSKKPGSTYPDIPTGNSLRASYFDKTDGNVYFFNQTHVRHFYKTFCYLHPIYPVIKSPVANGCMVLNVASRILY